MCGIAAILKPLDVRVDDVIDRMMEAVAHRGPDGAGSVLLRQRDGDVDVVRDGGWHASLGHRRLSIIDLSEAGAQPMRRGKLWITYNGEIYNFVEVRAELERQGVSFASHSDTEVLLAAYEQWGTGCFARLKGMWGLVIVDGERGVAVLSRDRLGIKPLYTIRHGGALYVASEIKELVAAGVPLVPNNDAVDEYLRTGHEDASRTFFAGVEPLAGGTFAVVRLRDCALVEHGSFWNPEHIRATVADAGDAAARFRDAFARSVREHMRSDVPVGCALSGGLDSSAVAGQVAKLRAADAPPFHVFTATFPGEPIDETKWVRYVVEHTHATSHLVAPTPAGFLDDLDRFTWIHDEPVGTLAMYAGFCVARTARAASVPVALNGQGGDEVFGGYWQTYFMHLRSLGRGLHVRSLLRHFAGAAMRGNPELLKQVPVMLRRYRARRSPNAVLRLRRASSDGGARLVERALRLDEQQRRVFEMREQYLPRLLKWDDRNFMAFAVEGRYPFLDHELIDELLSFTPEVLYDAGFTKMPLRRSLDGIVPKPILERRLKLGFETPQDKWLGGALRPAIERFVAGDSPAWAYVEPGEARSLARTVFSLEGKRDEPGQALLRLFFLDRWLRVFFDARGANAIASSSPSVAAA